MRHRFLVRLLVGMILVLGAVMATSICFNVRSSSRLRELTVRAEDAELTLAKAEMVHFLHFPDRSLILDDDTLARIYEIELDYYTKTGIEYYDYGSIVNPEMGGHSGGPWKKRKTGHGTLVTGDLKRYENLRMTTEPIRDGSPEVYARSQLFYFFLYLKAAIQGKTENPREKSYRLALQDEKFRELHIVPNLLRYTRSHGGSLSLPACECLILLGEHGPPVREALSRVAQRYPENERGARARELLDSLP